MPLPSALFAGPGNRCALHIFQKPNLQFSAGVTSLLSVEEDLNLSSEFHFNFFVSNHLINPPLFKLNFIAISKAASAISFCVLRLLYSTYLVASWLFLCWFGD